MNKNYSLSILLILLFNNKAIIIKEESYKIYTTAQIHFKCTMLNKRKLNMLYIIMILLT